MIEKWGYIWGGKGLVVEINIHGKSRDAMVDGNGSGWGGSLCVEDPQRGYH